MRTASFDRRSSGFTVPKTLERETTVFAALVALIFPIAAESVPAWAIFAFFGVMMVFHLLWAWFVVPETKGRSLLI